MSTARELSPGEERLAATALLELRPHLGDAAAVVEQAARQRDAGYRLAASFEDGDDDAAAVAGFRVVEHLAWGRALYVDDLITRADRRGRGHADAVWAVVERIARDEGCGELHLDSGVGPEREDAHRFYFRHGQRIASHHFQKRL
jgi:GNAT superfamily N-acetyltransferase